MSSVWLTRYQAIARPALRLVCFPYAGAGAAAFRPWVEGLPDGVEMWAVELPARARRIAEAPVADVPALAEALAGAVRAAVHGPCVFFGHSMGGLLAFEVCRRLAIAGAPPPAHLVVSARRAPQLPPRVEPIAGLSDAEFVRAIVERYDGIPEMVLREPELLSLFLPALRADLAALEGYAYEGAPPLPIPITALVGRDDPNAPAEDVAPWRDQTSAAFAMHTLPGAHFFINTHREEVLDLLRRHVFNG